ncbi:MAG: bifunctional folylpolyglutamate synthase/dihydrofolate synthase [Candidatus Marinimicrobia bacterium]|nr:bifunctional folylpolyglutamate synthase/dihydrofolate synthase [Candidatus Neomarinimicrobiota bacterium]
MKSKRLNYTHLEDILSDLYALRRDEIKLGLEHTIQLLDACENPQMHFDSIHIAGTNGKGSTGKMIASIFHQNDYSVGHYTSPHLVRFNERINVNNRNISDKYIVDFMGKYESEISEIKATYFEVITAMAFSYFRDNNIDLAVIETGLGGRLDSTNILDPRLIVFTPISLDHRDILGNSIKTIAAEKAGIIKEKTPIVSSNQKNDVKKVLEETSKRAETNINFINHNLITDIELMDDGTHFYFKDNKYFIPIVGDFQAENAALAIESSLLYRPMLDIVKIQEGLSKSYWMGRLQKMASNPTIYYDVSHNQRGIEKTLYNLKQLYSKKIRGIIALKGDKELDLICHAIENKFESLWIVSDKNNLLMNETDLLKEMQSYGIEGIVASSLERAIMECMDELTDGEIGLIFGSHYIASEVFDYFQFPFD